MIILTIEKPGEGPVEMLRDEDVHVIERYLEANLKPLEVARYWIDAAPTVEIFAASYTHPREGNCVVCSDSPESALDWAAAETAKLAELKTFRVRIELLVDATTREELQELIDREYPQSLLVLGSDIYTRIVEDQVVLT